jgi:hypothetical protein
MKPIFLCLIAFLLVTINSFSQVLQKKQITAPVIQKPEQKKVSIQPKATVTNPAVKQIIKPMDTANAKLTDVIITMGYRTCSNSSSDLILTHYKPQIDLFDENNRHIAQWEITNEDYTNNDIQNQKPDQDGEFRVTLHMKIDNNTAASFTSLKKGTFKISSNGSFYKGVIVDWVTAQKVEDFFGVGLFQVTLKFQSPSFKTEVRDYIHRFMYFSDRISLAHPAFAYSFSCNGPSFGIFDSDPLY